MIIKRIKTLLGGVVVSCLLFFQIGFGNDTPLTDAHQELMESIRYLNSSGSLVQPITLYGSTIWYIIVSKDSPPPNDFDFCIHTEDFQNVINALKQKHPEMIFFERKLSGIERHVKAHKSTNNGKTSSGSAQNHPPLILKKEGLEASEPENMNDSAAGDVALPVNNIQVYSAVLKGNKKKIIADFTSISEKLVECKDYQYVQYMEGRVACLTPIAILNYEKNFINCLPAFINDKSRRIKENYEWLVYSENRSCLRYIDRSFTKYYEHVQLYNGYSKEPYSHEHRQGAESARVSLRSLLHQLKKEQKTDLDLDFGERNKRLILGIGPQAEVAVANIDSDGKEPFVASSSDAESWTGSTKQVGLKRKSYAAALKSAPLQRQPLSTATAAEQKISKLNGSFKKPCVPRAENQSTQNKWKKRNGAWSQKPLHTPIPDQIELGNKFSLLSQDDAYADSLDDIDTVDPFKIRTLQALLGASGTNSQGESGVDDLLNRLQVMGIHEKEQNNAYAYQLVATTLFMTAALYLVVNGNVPVEQLINTLSYVAQDIWALIDAFINYEDNWLITGPTLGLMSYYKYAKRGKLATTIGMCASGGCFINAMTRTNKQSSVQPMVLGWEANHIQKLVSYCQEPSNPLYGFDVDFDTGDLVYIPIEKSGQAKLSCEKLKQLYATLKRIPSVSRQQKWLIKEGWPVSDIAEGWSRQLGGHQFLQLRQLSLSEYKRCQGKKTCVSARWKKKQKKYIPCCIIQKGCHLPDGYSSFNESEKGDFQFYFPGDSRKNYQVQRLDPESDSNYWQPIANVKPELRLTLNKFPLTGIYKLVEASSQKMKAIFCVMDGQISMHQFNTKEDR